MEFCFIASIVFLFAIMHEGSTKNCTHDIPHGEVTWWCSATTGNMCPYSCDIGYEKNPDVSWISCSSSGEWRPLMLVYYISTEDICLPKSCPQTIPNGKLSDNCDATVGTACAFSCNAGYEKNGNTISCDTSTNWSTDQHSLCTSNQQCPYEIEHGDLDLSCRRVAGESCNYTCHEGYLPSETSPSYEIRCESSLTWSKPLWSLCEKILCPTVIPHGVISSDCSREYKKSCYTYYCDGGYTTPPAEPGVRCNASGQWEWDEHQGDPCARRDELCPGQIKNGNLVWHCHRQHGATCTYNCNIECTKNRSVPWLNFENNSMWDKNTDTLCTCGPWTTPAPNLCGYSILNGRINRECSRQPFATCGYKCDDGCFKNYGALYCMSGSYWENENSACSCNVVTQIYLTRFICAKALEKDGQKTTTLSTCPQTIPNGYIFATCSRVPFYRCDYGCYGGCRPLFPSLMCTSSGSWSREGAACICQATETTKPSSQGGSFNIQITIGVIVGVMLLFIIISVVVYTLIKRKRQQRQTSSHCEREGRNNQHTVTGIDFSGASNRSVTPIYTLPNETNSTIQLPPVTGENSFTQQQPSNNECILQNPKPPEYSSIAQLDSRENPPPYELVMAYPADFRI